MRTGPWTSARAVTTSRNGEAPLALWMAAYRDAPAPGPQPRAGTPPQRRAPCTSGAGPARTAIDSWPACSYRTVVALPAEFTAAAAIRLTTAARLAVRRGGGLLLLHTGAGGASLLSTLSREEAGQCCLCVEVEPTPRALAAARSLAAAPPGQQAEISIDGRGRSRIATWQQVAVPATRPPLRPGDAVVITGGLGGLGRAVALHLSRRFAVHPVIVDLEAPGSPRAQAALAQLRQAGRPFTHLVADVTDAAAVRRVLGPVITERPPAAVVHCAGLVEGGRVRGLSAADLIRLAAPKVAGLHSVLAAVDTPRLRAVLAFGSILARRPHPGVGAYAMANELLRRAVDRWAARRPGPAYLTAEWSIWDGAGIAAETGAVQVARQAGYIPVPLAEGLRMVERLLGWTGPATSLVVSAASPAAVTPASAAPLASRQPPAGLPPPGGRSPHGGPP